jgi:immune inhibitor A
MPYLLLLLLATRLWAVPAAPDWQTVETDAGSFRLKVMGDEFCNWLIDEQSASLLLDRDGRLCYAEVDHTGQLLASSRIYDPTLAAPEWSIGARPDSHWIARNIDPLRQEAHQPATRNERVEGQWDVLLIMIQFPDLNNVYQTDAFEAMMNEPGYDGTGSFNDYFSDMSYGRYSTEASVTGWYTAENEHDYYGYNQGYQVARQLVREAVLAADADVDFSQFDNSGDGRVDALMIVHTGHGAEEGDQTNIWSHRWSLGNQALELDGVEINDYTMQPELQSGSQAAIGVYVHEFGHNLGLPDLYDTDYSSSGLGSWCLMSGGSWGGGGSGATAAVPSTMSAWCRDQLGWSTLIEPGVEGLSEYGLVATHLSDTIVRIPIEGSNQYFLAENRNRQAWDQHQPVGGLFVYHIDESVWGNTEDDHYLVDLEQADGLRDLNHGYGSDAGDIFPGSTGNRHFDSSTLPSSLPYFGEDSPVVITRISDPADTLVADFFSAFPHQNLRALDVIISWDLTENNWADADDMLELEITLFNDGAAQDSLWLSLSSPHESLIVDPVEILQLGVPGEGGFSAPYFSLTIHENAQPELVSLVIHSRNDEGWTQDVEAWLQVGRSELLVAADGIDSGLLDYFRETAPDWISSTEFRSVDAVDPAPDDLFHYPRVIWLLGAERTLEADRALALESYLNQGGNLLLSGQQLFDSASWLGFDAGEEVSGNPLLAGDTSGGLVFDNEMILLLGSLGAANQQMPATSLLVPGNARTILHWAASGLPAAATLETEGGRLLLCAFSLEAIHGISAPFLSQGLFQERAWAWLDEGFETDLPEAPATRPEQIGLSAAPNPFNPVTRLSIDLPEAGRYRLMVWNLKGQLVSQQELTATGSGHLDHVLDLGEAAGGLYLVQVRGVRTSSECLRLLLIP